MKEFIGFLVAVFILIAGGCAITELAAQPAPGFCQGPQKYAFKACAPWWTEK